MQRLMHYLTQACPSLPLLLHSCGLSRTGLAAGAEAGLVDSCPALSGEESEEMELAMEGLRLTGSTQLPAKATSQGLAGMVSIQCNYVGYINNRIKNHQSLENSRGLPLLENPGNSFPVLKFPLMQLQWQQCSTQQPRVASCAQMSSPVTYLSHRTSSDATSPSISHSSCN